MIERYGYHALSMSLGRGWSSITMSDLLVFVLIGSVSLFSITLISSPITILFSDVGFGAVTITQFLRTRRIYVSWIVILYWCLAFGLTLTGAFVWLIADSFSHTDHWVNFIRVFGVGIGLAVLPGLFHEVVAKKIVGIIQVLLLGHGLFILLEWVNLLSLRRGATEYTVTGLFSEPAWFAVWATLSLFLGLHMNRVAGSTLLRWWFPAAVFLLAFIVSSGDRFNPSRPSLAAFALLSVTALVSLWIELRASLRSGDLLKGGRRVLLGSSIVGVIAVVSLVLVVAYGNGTSPFERFWDRLSDATTPTPDGVADSSSAQRLFGSWEIAIASARDSAILGSGLGDDNLEAVFDRHAGDFRSAERPGIWQVPAEILRSAGVLGLAILLVLALYLLLRSETRLFTLGWLLIGIFWGDAYSPVVWLPMAVVGAILPHRTYLIRFWPRPLLSTVALRTDSR